MSGPYGPQDTRELLDRLVEEKGYMSAEDVSKWVDYVDYYINANYISKASVREAIDSMYNPSVSDIYQKEREEYDAEVVYVKDLKNILGLSEEGKKE